LIADRSLKQVQSDNSYKYGGSAERGDYIGKIKRDPSEWKCALNMNA